MSLVSDVRAGSCGDASMTRSPTPDACRFLDFWDVKEIVIDHEWPSVVVEHRHCAG